jgi:hypothetical protein
MERKRMVRTKLTELGIKCRTKGGEDAFTVGTPELMKLLKLREPVTIDVRQKVPVAVGGPNSCDCGRELTWAGRCPVCDS